MTATTANLLTSGMDRAKLRSYPVLASTTIYDGSIVFIDATTGYASGDDEAGANHFVGIAHGAADNSSGANAAINCEVYSEGNYRHLAFTGTATQATVGVPVYAVDNQTIQASSTNATFIGYCTEYIGAALVGVDINTKVAAA